MTALRDALNKDFYIKQRQRFKKQEAITGAYLNRIFNNEVAGYSDQLTLKKQKMNSMLAAKASAIANQNNQMTRQLETNRETIQNFRDRVNHIELRQNHLRDELQNMPPGTKSYEMKEKEYLENEYKIRDYIQRIRMITSSNSGLLSNLSSGEKELNMLNVTRANAIQDVHLMPTHRTNTDIGEGVDKNFLEAKLDQLKSSIGEINDTLANLSNNQIKSKLSSPNTSSLINQNTTTPLSSKKNLRRRLFTSPKNPNNSGSSSTNSPANNTLSQVNVGTPPPSSGSSKFSYNFSPSVINTGSSPMFTNVLTPYKSKIGADIDVNAFNRFIMFGSSYSEQELDIMRARIVRNLESSPLPLDFIKQKLKILARVA